MILDNSSIYDLSRYMSKSFLAGSRHRIDPPQPARFCWQFSGSSPWQSDDCLGFFPFDMFKLSNKTLYQQNKQRKMYKKNVDLIKHNQRNVDAFYNINKPQRHSSHTKTNPISTSYNPTIINTSQEKGTEESTLRHLDRSESSNQDAKKQIRCSADIKRKKTDSSAQQIYSLKKNAYKNYIREIYQKINDELKKKNSYFTLVTQNIKQINYSDAIITKEVKPISKYDQNEDSNIKKKLRERLRLEKLHEQTSSLEKIKQKLFVIKKNNDKKSFQIRTTNDFRSARFKSSVAYHEKPIETEQQQLQQYDSLLVSPIKEGSIIKTPQDIAEKKKEKTFSLNVNFNANKINIEDYIPAKKIFNKKDPFVCGLRGEKQSTQQKNRQKILLYIDFLWKINYSNSMYVKTSPEDITYKAYIGPGNNSLMIKSILKRRFWWSISDKPEGCVFFWAQLKQNLIFREFQEPSKSKKDSLYLFNQNLLLNKLSGERVTSTPQSKIFNKLDNLLWTQHLQRNEKTESSISEKTYLKRLGLLSKKNLSVVDDSEKLMIHNHLQQNFSIGNKKALYYHMKKYYSLKGLNLFDALPLTFHIKGVEDPEYHNFLIQFNRFDEMKKSKADQKNIWIVKPGEFSNRGNGISVCHSLDDIMIRLKSREKSNDGNLRTFIVQKYIEKPLLYKNRKFDIRHYILITCFNGCIKAYWYPEGYIRTSSSAFTLKRGGNLYVHLTNDAIQKNAQDYGKYEKGNKISYDKFQSYLDKTVKRNRQKNIFFDKILPEMKELTQNAVKSTYLSLDQKRKEHNFELLGMDFMIDQNYKSYLIQINTNPCLELSCPLLSRLIPSMIENAFKICIDPMFPPPEEWNTNKKLFLADNTMDQNKFQLIFDQSTEGKQLQKVFHGDFRLQNNIGKIQEDAEIYENDGQEQWQVNEIKKQE